MYNRSLETVYPAQWKLYAYYQLHMSPLPQPLATTMLPSASGSLITLDSSDKWNHAGFVLLGRAYFTERDALLVHPCCSIKQNIKCILF